MRSVPASVRFLALIFVAVIFVYMLLPLVVVVGASLSSSQFISFPPDGLSLQWYGAVLTSGKYLQPALTSLSVALVVTVLAVLVGTPAAIAITRYRFPGANLASTLFLSPLIIPTIIVGIGLLIFFSRLGGRPSIFALIVGHLVIAVPYIIRTVSAVLVNADRHAEEAARVMGARWYERYWFVVLPQALPGIAAGAFFTFNISFDEAVIALFLRTPQLVTLPIRIYGELEFSASPEIAAVATLMILVTVGLIVAIERFLGINQVVA